MRRHLADPTRQTLMCACWAIGITIATASYLGLIYPTLPYGLPVRYEHGEPFIYQLKTPGLVMLPATVQAALLLTFGSLGMLLLWRSRPESGDAEALADSARMRLAVEGIAWLGALWITVQAIGAARLIALWQGGRGGFGTIYSVTMLTALVVSVVVVVRTMRAVRAERAPRGPTDPGLWRLANLYFNPRDPALFVPLRSGLGWTLNFGRPLAIVLLTGILLIGIGAPYYIARLILRLGD